MKLPLAIKNTINGVSGKDQFRACDNNETAYLGIDRKVVCVENERRRAMRRETGEVSVGV